MVNCNFDNEAVKSRLNNEECIIAYKIFDQCRKQICLTPCMLGPARAAHSSTMCSDIVQEGDIIVPPINATSVSLEDLTLCKVIILNKKQNPFRCGYWDIEIKFVFCYNLAFRSSDCCFISCVRATSVHTMKVTLFGSIGSETAMATDLNNTDCSNVTAGPFVSVEGKAAGLAAELKLTPRCNCDCNCNCGCGCDDTPSEIPTAVCVTIGLFSVVKIFRPVNLIVNSLGCCIPEECTAAESSENPCDFFESLSFPVDFFCPPSMGDIECKKGCDCGCK